MTVLDGIGGQSIIQHFMGIVVLDMLGGHFRQPQTGMVGHIVEQVTVRQDRSDTTHQSSQHHGELYGLDDVEPLFTPDDYYVFDKYADGDPYEDEMYIRHFRMVIHAVKEKKPLKITMRARTGGEISFVMEPDHMEYSEKDDKFRLIGTGRKYADTVNIARIVSCRLYEGDFIPHRNRRLGGGSQSIELELIDERNALERVLLHFAHFEKQAEKLDEKRYKVQITYDKEDETEVLIRVLSFGPMVKVIGPTSFIKLIKERLIKQQSFET